MAKWAKLDTRKIVPESWFTIADQAAATVEQATVILDTWANNLQAYAAAVGLSQGLNPQLIAAKAAVEALKAALEAIAAPMQGGAQYLIVAPTAPEAQVPTLALQLGTNVADRTTLNILGPSLLGTGGNYGFFKTVYESMNDRKDIMRPKYDSTDAVAGLVLLAGSDSFIGLQDAMAFYKMLLGPHAIGLDANVYPTPTNFRINYQAWPKAARLEWSSPVTVNTLKYKINKLGIAHVCVYRHTENFRTDLPASQLLKYQIAKLPYSPLELYYEDKTIEDGKTYYYAVGFELVVTDTDGVEHTFPAPQVTAARYMVPPTPPLPRYTAYLGGEIPGIVKAELTAGSVPWATGTPPDWIGLNATAQFVPSIQNLVSQLNGVVGELESLIALELTGDKLAGLLRISSGNKAKLIAAVRRIVDELRAILVPVAGLYALPFAGEGGNEFILTTLYNSLFSGDPADRPPFDTGREFVCGVVLLAGGDTAAISGVKALGSLFEPVADDAAAAATILAR